MHEEVFSFQGKKVYIWTQIWIWIQIQIQIQTWQEGAGIKKNNIIIRKKEIRVIVKSVQCVLKDLCAVCNETIFLFPFPFSLYFFPLGFSSVEFPIKTNFP